MRRTRNLIALLMAAAMCLCLFAGCGSSNNGNDSEAVDLTKATSLADLAGCKIAAQAGTFHADALTQIKNVQSSTYPRVCRPSDRSQVRRYRRLCRRRADSLLRLPVQ